MLIRRGLLANLDQKTLQNAPHSSLVSITFIIKFRIFFIALACSLVFDASAQLNICKELSKLSETALNDCHCSGVISDYQQPGSRALPLVAVCGYREEPTLIAGHFLYVGMVSVRGEVRREDTESYGDEVTFVADERDRKLLPQSAFWLSFRRNTAAAVRRFKIPHLSSRSSCFTAPAKIALTKLYVASDAGFDWEGAFPLQYQALEVGKFTKCGTPPP